MSRRAPRAIVVARVFDPDVRFAGFTSTDWQRVLALFSPQPGAADAAAPNGPSGGVVVVLQAGQVQKLIHSQVGRLRLDDLLPVWPVSAAELARRHDASWALVVDVEALDEIMEGFAARARLEDDSTAQLLLLLTLTQRQLATGRMELWPSRLLGLPMPTATMVDRALDLICPAGRSAVLGLFDGSVLWTALAVSRGPSGIDAVVGPEPMRNELDALSGELGHDAQRLQVALTRCVAPLSFGCFADYRTFCRLEVDAAPGAWAAAVRTGRIILDPLPAALKVPLAFDASLGAVRTLHQLSRRWDAPAALAAGWSAATSFASARRAIVEALGFDPLDALRKLLSRER